MARTFHDYDQRFKSSRFVAGALPDETVEVQRVNRSRKFDLGKVLNVIEASPYRVEPPCPVFDNCGGCALQHLDSEQQILYKQKQLMDNLERIGKVTPNEVLPPLKTATTGYRRRARLGVRYVHKKSRVLIGFREKFSNYITDMPSCLILDKRINALLPELSELILSLSIKRELPQIEVSAGDNAIAMVFRILEDLSEEDSEKFIALDKKHADLHVYLQRGGLDTITPVGEYPALEYGLGVGIDGEELVMDFQPSDFVQVNAELNKNMIARALTELNLTGTESVLDLFCGLGNFTLPIAQQAKEVVGVEGEKTLVDRAQANMQKHGVTNVSYHTANLFEDFKKTSWAKRYDIVFIDPPRAGAELVCQQIEVFDAPFIVYISCHPGSLARDCGILVNEKGYVLEKAGVMDMFPHTAHVESIAVLRKSK